MSTQKSKIGKGYYQSGYARGFKKTPTVWLINGKAYAKDSTATPFQTDLDGHVMLNHTASGFYEVGLISEHKQYNS